MAMPLTYSNNTGGLIDFALVISTYGVRFVESGSKEAIKNFREILVCEVLPYYTSHLQVAFGEMYLWNAHNNSTEQGKNLSLSHSVPKTEDVKVENDSIEFNLQLFDL